MLKLYVFVYFIAATTESTTTTEQSTTTTEKTTSKFHISLFIVDMFELTLRGDSFPLIEHSYFNSKIPNYSNNGASDNNNRVHNR